MRAPLPTPKKIFDLEGEAQLNSDGVSRQEELWRCVPGEPVHLQLDGRDAASPREVVVLSSRGVPIGRLTRLYAALLAPLLDSRRPHRVKLHCLRGGLPGYPLYGARISIAWDGRPEHPHRPLDEEQTRYRARRTARGSFRGSIALPALVDSPRPVLAVADREAARIALLLAIAVLSLLALLLVQRLASSWCWACG
jgi:hypothetical protein